MTSDTVGGRLGDSPREELQLELLNDTIARAKANSAFYRDRIEVDRLDSLDELSELPLTKKDDIRGLDGRPTQVRDDDDVVEYHTSSGTMSDPFVMMLSEEDIRTTKEVLSRTWALHGIERGDTVQMMVSYGLFTAGILNQYAIQHLGASVVPTGIRSTDEQLEYIDELEPDYLVAVSSYYLRLIDVVERRGIELPDFEGVIGGGVPVTDAMADRISDRLDAPFYNQYGLAEVNTGIAGECDAHDGLHVRSEYVYPEVVDKETHEPLPEGEEGLLVLTTLQRDAQVMIRYLTNDITSISYEPCECGRTTPRIAPVRGRYDDVIFVRGAKLDIVELQTVMEELEGVLDPYKWQLRIGHENGRDTLTVVVDWQGSHRPELVKDALGNAIEVTIDDVVPVSDLDADILDHKLERVKDHRGGNRS